MRVSISKIQTFLDCPRKYWYQYELYMRTKKSEGFYFGSAIHAGLENYYMGKDPMEAVDNALFGEKMALEEQVEEGIDLSKLHREAKRIFKIYNSQAPRFEPLLIEYMFKVELVHPKTQEKLPASFIGIMDLVTVDSRIIDHKTSSGSPNGFFDRKNKFQATGYSYAFLNVFKRLPSRFIINNVIKGNTRREPRIEPRPIDISMEDINTFFEIVKYFLDKVEKQETRDYPNINHCKFCRMKGICPYYKRE